jgi:hypothetical protein
MGQELNAAGLATVINKLSADAAKTITGATNASPAVITIASHGFVTGDWIGIENVGGNTNVNILGKVVAIDANTFSITTPAGVAINGNSAYTSGGTATRIRVGLTPADLADIQTTLDRRKYPQSSDAHRGNQQTLRTIFGL